MMLCNITIAHLANDKTELDNDTEILKSIARKYMCELSTLYFSKRQLDGVVTVLPIGINRLNIVRTLLTESASVSFLSGRRKSWTKVESGMDRML